jgi:hypothetical protein
MQRMVSLTWNRCWQRLKIWGFDLEQGGAATTILTADRFGSAPRLFAQMLFSACFFLFDTPCLIRHALARIFNFSLGLQAFALQCLCGTVMLVKRMAGGGDT